MSLKDLTAEKHTEAENTPFMKAVFANTLSSNIWADWTYNKILICAGVESTCAKFGHLNDLPNINRVTRLWNDYLQMTNNQYLHTWHDQTINYNNYIRNLDSNKSLAHLYVWYLGDMYGGQMIRETLTFPTTSLEFEDVDNLKINLRSKLTDDLAEEANIAFDWAINIMRTYDSMLAQN